MDIINYEKFSFPLVIVCTWETMKDMQAFSGSVLVCEFYKKFSGQTIVASRTLNTKFIGKKSRWTILFLMINLEFLRTTRSRQDIF
nr:hypothetical protein [uncultured Campylobacter sp.]